uniref:Transforming acidic coiled-coil-containing protein C-terminal domain-containing protein n=1 Tax=Myripristis murdjan TaxID=586833 RepID=A0A667YLP4_9TELE
MSWLSPVQWAKWTWSAVTGGTGDEGQAGQQGNEDDDEHNFCSLNGGHATDEEKLANSASVKPDKDQSSEKSGPGLHLHQRGRETGGSHPHQGGGSPSPFCTLSPCRTPQLRVCLVLGGLCMCLTGFLCLLMTDVSFQIITKEMEASDWKRKFEESRQEVSEMRKIVAEYEKTIAQMVEDEQRNNLSSQKSLHAMTMEKEAALADLNSVERSLSDLFRRYENMKSTLEGFKKNEEVLKKCAQEYLARVKQEEQRYQTLKLHAEEKLDKANEEIAQVRAKSRSENMALTASLRKEQMKVESLEGALQQKVTLETLICDRSSILSMLNIA